MIFYTLFKSRAKLAMLVSLLPCVLAASIQIGSFDGPVTTEEIQSFNRYMATLHPANDNIGNNWVQGHSGEQTKALGLVYLMSGDTATLDIMIPFCDAVLSQRNDLAPAPLGQHKIWTGRIDPCWPNDITQSPIATGGGEGDPVGHLASCAYLILKTESIYNKKVTGGDPHSYGATYLARAKTYLKEADKAMSDHILKSLLDLSDKNRMYFAKNSPYQGGGPVPWNQQMMFNYAFQNLCNAHRILNDNKELVAKYKGIINASFDWFFNGGGSVIKTSSKKTPIYDWSYSYSVPMRSSEDSNHASLDVAGFARAYISKDYGITAAQMKNFANMYVDVMTLGGGKYAGEVDGSTGTSKHSQPTTYVRSGNMFLAEFRPDAYKSLMEGAGLKEGGTTGSPDAFSRYLWVKNQRHVNGS
jgi:hypothetical protein